MPFLKSKSKFESTSQCSLEKEGQRCPNTWKFEEEYIYDTDGKKAYCCKHDEINSKVTQGGGFKGGGYQKATMPLHRETEDGLKACGAFAKTVVPAIKESIEALKDLGVSTEKIYDSFVAIYLGKFPSGK